MLLLFQKQKTLIYLKDLNVDFNVDNQTQRTRPLQLRPCEIANFIWHFENVQCYLHASDDKKNVKFRLPENHKHMGIHIDAKRWGFEIEL